MQTASKIQLDTEFDMAWNIKMASQLLSDPNTARVFRAIEDGRGRLSGWRLVKNVELSTDEVTRIVSELKNCGVIEATDAGLDGYYYLTKLGFSMRHGLTAAG